MNYWMWTRVKTNVTTHGLNTFAALVTDGKMSCREDALVLLKPSGKSKRLTRLERSSSRLAHSCTPTLARNREPFLA